MPDREKVIKGLEWILDGDRFGFGENWYIDSEPKTEEEKAGYYIQRAITLLKEQKETNDKLTMAFMTLPDWNPVVTRCKNCKHWIRRECGSYGTCESENMNICGFTDANWFCADGERMKDG